MARRLVAPLAVLSGSFVFLLAKPAEAYLDPGVGSYVFQMSMALFFAVAFTIRMHWRKLKLLLSRLLSRSRQDGNTD